VETILIVPITSIATAALMMTGQALLGFLQTRTASKTSEVTASTSRYQAVLQHDVHVSPFLLEMVKGLQARLTLLEAQNVAQAAQIDQLEQDLDDCRRGHIA
jgi:hypothetical protein